MGAKVYVCRIPDWSDIEEVARRAREFLAATTLLQPITKQELVGIKLTFGEAGNDGHPPPALIRELAAEIRGRGARPFITETSTLYRGRRMNAVDHLEVAREHGFTHETIGAPLILSDGLRGRETFDVPISGHHTQIAHLAPVVRDMDRLIAVAHLTGHMVHGFGGTLKNLGMGLASRAGKLEQHSAVSPRVNPAKCTLCGACAAACPAGALTPGADAMVLDNGRCIGCADCLAVCPTGAMSIDWSRDARQVQEATAEYAWAVAEALAGRAVYVNLLNHVSRHCDCMGATKDLLVPDIGLAAGTDPVALDQASVDLVCEAAGQDVFREAWPEVEWSAQLVHAEEVGIGSRAYELVG